MTLITQKSGAKKMKAKNSGWVSKKLGQIVEMTSGGTPDKKFKEYYDGGTIPWVRSGELDKGVITDSEVKITQAGLDNSSAKIFPKGTLLIAMYGATIGKLAYLGIDAATNQAICAMFKNDTILLEYLYYFLLFQRPNLVKQGVGGAQPNISQTILKKLLISYPENLAEQQRIVTRIEELLSQLDEGVETLKKTQVQLEVYRQAVLKAVFEKTGGDETRLEDVCFFITKGTTPPKNKMSADNGDVPFIKVYNLTFDNTLDFTIDPTFVDVDTHTSFLARSKVLPGDVLMNIVGPPM
jgi:type I restriction enzyme S subunit